VIIVFAGKLPRSWAGWQPSARLKPAALCPNSSKGTSTLFAAARNSSKGTSVSLEQLSRAGGLFWQTLPRPVKEDETGGGRAGAPRLTMEALRKEH
jgi:hypothetical protein